MATGSVAGRLVGSPVRRSKHDPCNQHSMVGAPLNSSTSPSESGTSACEHMSSMAYTEPSKRTTAMSMSASSTRSAPGSATSDSPQTRSKAMSGPLDRLLVETREGTQALLDGPHE